jgi:hypothetical protein
MTLPKIITQTFEVQLPSNGSKIIFRPFLVKEEKLLLIAAETRDPNEIINTTKQVITNCIVHGNFNIDLLPFFDIDYLFVLLRAKSVGETVSVNFRCNNVVDGKDCGAIFPVDIDITNIKVEKPNIDDKIWITPMVGVKMKYPKYSAMKLAVDNENEYDRRFRIIQNSIEMVFNDTQTWSNNKDFTLDDSKEFLESLTQQQYAQLEKWIDNFPDLYVQAEHTCEKCKFHHTIKYRDFDAFFF